MSNFALFQCVADTCLALPFTEIDTLQLEEIKGILGALLVLSKDTSNYLKEHPDFACAALQLCTKLCRANAPPAVMTYLEFGIGEGYQRLTLHKEVSSSEFAFLPRTQDNLYMGYLTDLPPNFYDGWENDGNHHFVYAPEYPPKDIVLVIRDMVNCCEARIRFLFDHSADATDDGTFLSLYYFLSDTHEPPRWLLSFDVDGVFTVEAPSTYEDYTSLVLTNENETGWKNALQVTWNVMTGSDIERAPHWPDGYEPSSMELFMHLLTTKQDLWRSMLPDTLPLKRTMPDSEALKTRFTYDRV